MYISFTTNYPWNAKLAENYSNLVNSMSAIHFAKRKTKSGQIGPTKYLHVGMHSNWVQAVKIEFQKERHRNNWNVVRASGISIEIIDFLWRWA
jgi:hypothetical protein